MRTLHRIALRGELVLLWFHETSLRAHALEYPGSVENELAELQERQREIRAELERS
jgi:hypothetical protein